MKHVISALFVSLFIHCSGFQSALAQQTPADTTLYEVGNPTNMTPRKYKILGVTVVGAETTNESFIPATSGLEEGDEITYPGEDIAEAVRRLYKTGLYEDVRIVEKQRMGSGLFLEIVVREQPRLREYKLEGIKKKYRRDLEDEITLLKGFAVTDAQKSQAVSTIKRYFKKKGFWETEVEVTRADLDTARNRVTLMFDIDAGERYEIKDIIIKGNESFKERELRKKLKPLKEDAWYKFFGKKLFKEEEFEEGKLNLLNFYRENGYRDVRLLSDSVYIYKYKRDKKGIAVELNIEEGPQYVVRNINFDGNTVYEDERLLQALDFKRGDVFNEAKFDQNLNFNKDENDVTSLYQNVGYLFFQVQPEINVVEGDSLDINIYIFEDEIATVNQVAFTGNNKTHDDVVRRMIRTVPGQTFNRSAIIRTIRELGQLGYFVPENISPDLNPDRENKEVDITYQLSESESTDNFEFSGGFGGQGIGVILSARVNFTNFSVQNMFNGSAWRPLPTGDGQRLSLGVQLTGAGFQSYNFNFSEPWFLGRPTSLGFAFQYSIIDFRGSDIRNEQLLTSVSIGKRLSWPDDYFQWRNIITYRDLSVSGAAFFTGNNNVISLTQVIERNSQDNALSPTSGSRFRLSGEFAPPVAGLSQFFKIRNSYVFHIPVFADLVISSGTEYGYIGFFGKNDRNNFNRFFLGGTAIQQRQAFINDNVDLRGYPGGSNDGLIAPRVNGQPVGGRIYTKQSIEFRYPAITSDQLRLIPYLFYDAGNSYLDFANFDPFNVKRAIGPGLRIFLPVLGLVDLSLGRRLDGIDGNPRINAGEWEFLFNIGSPFQ